MNSIISMIVLTSLIVAATSLPVQEAPSNKETTTLSKIKQDKETEHLIMMMKLAQNLETIDTRAGRKRPFGGFGTAFGVPLEKQTDKSMDLAALKTEEKMVSQSERQKKWFYYPYFGYGYGLYGLYGLYGAYGGLYGYPWYG
jgi:hypothetical protein